MPDYRCEVLTAWDNRDGDNVADVVRRYAGAWTDVTGQPDAHITPSPNAVVLAGLVTSAALDAIEADPAVTVLWNEVII